MGEGSNQQPDHAGETALLEESQGSAFESLLRRVAETPAAEDLAPTDDLGPGVIVAGRFEVVREIGRGGFARVFEARDRVLARQVAIKLLKRRRRLSDPELELFYREARATARLNHPHIVTAYDWGVWNDAPFLVLELLDGESLQAQLTSGALSESRAWEIAGEIAESLVYAHSQGVLHLDLKSENIVVLRDGRVKVLDFGLAGLEWGEEAVGGLTRIAGGTPATMAPEQEEGATTDARTDLWAVGMILYQMMFGRLPDRLAPEADRVPLPLGASPQAQEVLGRTLRRDREMRYPDAVALSQAVTEGPRARSRRRRASMVLAASALAVAGLSAAGITLARLQKEDYFWRNPLANARYQRLTDFEGAEHSGAISRDGQLVAFLSSRDGPVSVFVTRIGTATFRNLTLGLVPEQLVNREIRTIEFSPDAASLYFWVGGSDTLNRPISTWTVPTRGGEPSLALKDVAEIGWSPDGRQLAYHTWLPGDPMFVKSGSADARPLYDARVPQHAHFPTWSPDGSYIYFVQGLPPNEMDIWRIRPGGGVPERITFHNSRVSYPTFLDRSTLVYLATGTNGAGPWIYGLDVNRRVPHRLSSGVERWTSLATSGDGRRLVATSTQIRPSLWRVPLSSLPAGVSEAKRIRLPTAHGRSPMLGRDLLLYVSSDETTERIWELVGERTIELWTSASARIIGGPAIAPDGHQIAFSTEDRGKTRLMVINLDGSGLRTVTETLELRGAPVWSPDGRWIVTAVNQGESPRLFRISIETGEAARIVDDYALDPVWAPQGDFLVYSGMDPGTAFPVKAITPAGQPYSIPKLSLSRGGALGVTQVGARRMRFLPGQTALIVLRGDIQDRNLWARDLTSESWRQVTNFGRDVVIGDFDVSAEGTAVVLERVEEHSDIVVIDRTE
jgi:Tol biopolymer transport system component/tRNA A-37 threonylcarbamoyl transferase component Bud32